MTAKLLSEEIERLFTLGFALDQMQRDFIDLERCIREQAESFPYAQAS